MATYKITQPDGSEYDVTAPDYASAVASLKKIKPPTVSDSAGNSLSAYQEPPIALEPGERVLSLGTPKTEAAATEKQAPPLPSMGESALRGAYQGATFDLGDRISALEAASGLPEAPAALGPINTLYNMGRLGGGVGRRIAEILAPHIFGEGGKEAYNKKFEEERAANEQARGVNPYSYTAGAIGGGLLTLPFAPELAPFKAAEAANAALPIGKMLGNAATAGAGYGAVTGAASSDDLTNPANVATNAVIGAGTGAVLGPAVATGVRGVAGAGNIARNQYLAMTDPEKLAAEITARKLAAEAAPGQTAVDVAQQARDRVAAAQQQAVPQPLTMADVAGPKVQQLAGSVTRDPNEAGARGTKFLEERHFGVDPYNPDAIDSQKARINAALINTLGSGRVRQVAEDLVQQRANNAKPLFQAAEIQSIPYDTSGGRQLLDTLERIPVEAKNHANNFLQVSGESGNQAIWKNVGGQMQLVAVPNVRRFSQIKQGLDQLIESEYNKDTGRYTPYGRELIKLKNEILSQLDKLVPEYAKARSKFRGETEVINALRQGRMFNKFDHDRVIEEMSHLGSDLEREMFRIGASEALRFKVNNSPIAADAVKQIYNSPEAIRKIREIAP